MRNPYPTQGSCAIARAMGVLGERWTVLILREAFSGATRFSQFRAALSVAPDVLTERLSTLVDNGILVRRTYQEPGHRARDEYLLTDAGSELTVVLAALQQWADVHMPWPDGPTVVRRAADGRPLHVGFVDDTGAEVDRADARFVRTPAYPA